MIFMKLAHFPRNFEITSNFLWFFVNIHSLFTFFDKICIFFNDISLKIAYFMRYLEKIQFFTIFQTNKKIASFPIFLKNCYFSAILRQKCHFCRHPFIEIHFFFCSHLTPTFLNFYHWLKYQLQASIELNNFLSLDLQYAREKLTSSQVC